MQKQQIEQQAETAAAIAADWKNSIAKIETQLNVAGLALMRAKKQREVHALKASLGDPAAIEAIKAARSEQHTAEQTISDLRIALPEAEANLAIAEKAAESARRALARFAAEGLMRKRVDVAAQIDIVTADFARLYAEYERLGREIINMEALPRSSAGMNDHDGATGARRVRASLPKFFWRLFPGAITDEMKHEPLAVSESRYWNLAPEQAEKAA
ncbi:hypothetical protein [Bradyrhizobium sp. Ash2021]|uniref:hypothetical protein n=1 Tax=Bradyrhizobium sp. Ash2021 TaxID=2954771 RepID=UPI0028169CF4|nr:hypothetical protein [Bradyrhizobium sp. Ash2021]WMT77454.1 hypothetical protein NL528_14340 [Bradyrhizobium sp. Ash2021]